jgi:5-methylcytosine-specific restriction endonuclease McrA
MIFTPSTKRNARWRQKGKCAVCGDDLEWQEEFAHHIYPHSLGGADKVENCAILCGPCHNRVHNDGRFRSRVVAPRSYFPFLEGR